jgi:hypothetical protein
MVIRAQIGNSPNVGLLILGLRLVSGVILLGHIVDATLIFLPVGVDHGSSVASVRVTFSLHMPLFLAVAAYDVGVAGPVAEDRRSVHGGAGVAAGFWLRGALFLRTAAIWLISSMPMSSQGMLAASAGARLALTVAIL